MTPEFWRGKKVFVTGHTGFKGSWLTAMLLEMGAEVTGYSLAPATSPALFDLLGLATKINHIEGDVRDRAQVTAAVKKADPDVLLHLAAQALVRESYTTPVETFDTNVTGTLNILEAARDSKNLRAMVVITTDKCYLNNDSGRYFKEDDSLGGKDPYSASKAAAEIVCHAYNESFFKKSEVAMATARAGNVVGGGDWAKDRLIPDVFRAMTAQQPVMIRSPQATRPWQHVLEPLRGYLMLAEKLFMERHAFAGGWNFGPQPEDIQSVGHVLTLLKKELPFELQMDTAPQPVEAKTLALDIHKAVEQLGWAPLLDLADTIEWTGAWYNAFANNTPAAELTATQIRKYFELAQSKEYRKIRVA